MRRSTITTYQISNSSKLTTSYHACHPQRIISSPMHREYACSSIISVHSFHHNHSVDVAFFNVIVLAQILFPFPLLPLKLLCCHRHHHHRSDLLSSITPSTTKGIISNNKLSLARAQAHPESYAIEPLSLFHSLPHSCAPLSFAQHTKMVMEIA